MTKLEWCSAEWEPASECISVDLFFSTAPPDNQKVYFALGVCETKYLIKKLQDALPKESK